MPQISQTTDLAITTGIKHVAIGKRGSKALPNAEMAQQIKVEIQDSSINLESKGAFLGALIIKGLSETEQSLREVHGIDIIEEPVRLIRHFVPGIPDNIQNLIEKLIAQKTLTVTESQKMGDYLFSNETSPFLCGFVASILRVRYETIDEYEGLLKSIAQSFHPQYTTEYKKSRPLVQLAEPFDGVDHSNLITPLLAMDLQKKGYQTVGMIGKNSGPKFGNNLLDVCQALKLETLSSSKELENNIQPFGHFLHQSDLSDTLDRWVTIRHHIVKRPFLATIERFVNPFNADIMIASAFHPGYDEKMISICQRLNFPSAIIIRNGIEGTIAFALKRPCKILCTIKTKTGEYITHNFDFDAQKYLNQTFAVEEKLEQPSLEKNISLIKEYLQHGKTNYELFDARVKATRTGINQALEWINQQKDN